MSSNHVRRYAPINQQNPQQSYTDPRMQSNPQPIPQNSAFPVHRGSAPQNYPTFSPAQSPQHGQFTQHPPMYSGSGGTPNEMSPYQTSGTLSYGVKPHPNGQNVVWPRSTTPYVHQTHSQPQLSQTQMPQYNNTGTPPIGVKYSQPPPPQSTAPPFQTYQQSTVSMTMPHNNPVLFMPHVRQQRMVSPNVHAQMQNHPPSQFYQSAPPFYPHSPNQASYGGNSDQAQFHRSSQQVMRTSPAMMPPYQPQPIPPTPISRKSTITIKDPTTLQDVTKDVLGGGKRQIDSASPSAISGNASAVSLTNSQDRIAAQFAAQVAAAATASPDKSSLQQNVPQQTERKMETPSKPAVLATNSQPSIQAGSPAVLPSGVDVTFPPPPLQMIPTPQQIPSGTSPTTVGAAALKGTVMASPVTVAQNLPPPRLFTNKSRADTPVAVVQPVPVETHPTEVAPVSVPKPTPLDGSATQDVTNNSQAEALTCQPAVTVEHEVPIGDVAATNGRETTEKASKDNEGLVSRPTNGHDSDNSISQVVDNSAATEENVSVSDAAVKEQTEKKTEMDMQGTAEHKSADVPSSISTPVVTISSPPPVATTSSFSQEDSSLSVIEPQDESAAQEKANIQSNTEEMKKDVDQYEVKAMSGDSAVSKAEKVSALPDQPEVPPAILQVDKPVLEELSSKVDADDLLSKEVKVNDTDETDDKKKEPFNEAPAEDNGDDDPTKKKVYDRSFLMQFRFHDVSLAKPMDLPEIGEIIMDRPLPKSSISTGLPSLFMERGADFTPTWMGGGGGGGHRPGRNTSRGSRGGGQQRPGGYGGYQHSGSQSGPKIIKKVSIQKEPELNKAENAWKPTKSDTKPAGQPLTEEDQTAEVLRNVRSILNKLTPQKFSSLMQKFQDLPINTEVRLREVINLIFEKAIDEPNFCEAYANMCRTMSQFRITALKTAAQTGTTVEFRKILLTRCQKEFEKDRANEDKLLSLRQKVEEAKTPEEKQQCKDDLEFAEGKERRRMLGNIRFIGELFKLNMLTESIMHNCVMTLFKSREEESLESLCRLLTTIGKDLDHAKGKARMDQYFNQIEKIIRERKTSSRVRFMLQDVKDLRLNNWVQRAIKAQGPKTIDQIHADAKEEKQQLALQVAASVAAPPIKQQSRGNRMGSRGSSGHTHDEGWTKVQKPVKYDPNKMKLSKFDESNVTLGPNRAKTAWKSGSGSVPTKTGSGGYSSRDAMNSVAPRSSTPTMMMNRFSALGVGAGQDSHRAGGRLSSQERTKSDSRGSTGSGGSRQAGRDERQSVIDATRRLTSTEKKRASPVLASSKAAPTPAVSDTKPAIDETALIKKINSTIAEYLHLVDIKEATECLDELKMPTSQTYLIVKTCLEATLEKSKTHRISIASLLCHLVSQGKIIPEQYIKGVVENMELAIDVELDLPKVWTCLAELVAPIFYKSHGKVKLARVKELAEPLFEFEKAAIFLVEILKNLTTQMTVDTAVQYWKETNLEMKYFFKGYSSEDMIEFLQRHNLESFSDGQSETSDGRSQLQVAFDRFQSSITKQLDSKRTDAEIFEWIGGNVTKEERSHSTFVRALTTAVCHKAIIQGDNKLEVDKDIIKRYTVLLKRYVDSDDKELQAVYALQKLFVDLEQPPNILKLLFDSLYDEEVISEQTFFKWEKKEDPKECEGKGVALLSVNPFFTWLREEEEVESDE